MTKRWFLGNYFFLIADQRQGVNLEKRKIGIWSRVFITWGLLLLLDRTVLTVQRWREWGEKHTRNSLDSNPVLLCPSLYGSPAQPWSYSSNVSWSVWRPITWPEQPAMGQIWMWKNSETEWPSCQINEASQITASMMQPGPVQMAVTYVQNIKFILS